MSTAPSPAVVSLVEVSTTTAPLSDRQKMLVFSVMALGMFMALLDIQIVAASLSEIVAGLGAANSEGSRVQTAYLIAEIVMIPLSGFLGRALSTRWLFVISAAAFTISSVACGLAWNLESMIVFRAIQDFVGGAMIPTAFAAGFLLLQGPKQALIPAILGITGTLAPTLGPTLGGLDNADAVLALAVLHQRTARRADLLSHSRVRETRRTGLPGLQGL